MTIIGVGLIGGSLGLAVKQKKLVKQVVGYGRRRGALHRAVSLNAIDRYFLTLPKAVKDADLIVLATPVGTFEKFCQAMGPHLKEGAIVTDVGSVKGDLVRRLDALLPSHVHFVGGHPIAGKEKSGVLAATGSLFKGSRTILTPIEKTDQISLKAVASLWSGIGSNVSEENPFDHDRILGVVSHLPHVVAYALMETLTHPSLESMNPVEYSAGGLRDFTRIAGSSSEMWRDIFLLNREAVLEGIDLYQEAIEKIKKRIISTDGDGLLEIFEHAKVIQKQVRT